MDKHSSSHLSNMGRRILAHILVPVCLLVLGYGLLYVVLGSYLRIGYNVLSMFSNSTDLIAAESKEVPQLYDANAVKVADSLPDSIPISEVDMPDSGMYYAQLICDKIDMDVPLYWDSNDATLRKGAGQYMGSFMPGFGKPILIAGHNHTYFNCLKDLQVGDVITIDTNYDTYTYEIFNVRQMKEDLFEYAVNISLGKDEELLVMYTCYPFEYSGGRSTERIVFYGKRTSGSDVIWRIENG